MKPKLYIFIQFDNDDQQVSWYNVYGCFLEEAFEHWIAILKEANDRMTYTPDYYSDVFIQGIIESSISHDDCAHWMDRFEFLDEIQVIEIDNSIPPQPSPIDLKKLDRSKLSIYQEKRK